MGMLQVHYRSRHCCADLCVEDIQANRELLCRPVPLSLIHRRYEKAVLKISFQEAFIAISRFKEALQKFGEEIRQSILHSSDEILEQSQPRPVVGIMLQCSANAALPT